MTTAKIDLPPYRPPSEAQSVLLRVTRGCTWNRCAFCGMYKQLRFALRDFDEIAEDIAASRKIWSEANAIFLGDSDSLVHPRLPDIVALVRQAFPEAERITSYSRLNTLRRLPIEKLHALRAAGLRRIHAGLESGSARILARARKGLTPDQAIRGGQRAVAAGFDFCLYVLCGLGGEDDWQEHARETARVVAAIHPQFVRLRSLALLPGTPLHEEWQAGRFRPITPASRLRELRLFLETLPSRPAPAPVEPAAEASTSAERRAARASPASQPRSGIEIRSDHFTNYVWVDGVRVFEGIAGQSPEERRRMIAVVDEALARVAAGRRAEDIGSLALRRVIPHL